jgi:hypothetical protein
VQRAHRAAGPRRAAPLDVLLPGLPALTAGRTAHDRERREGLLPDFLGPLSAHDRLRSLPSTTGHAELPPNASRPVAEVDSRGMTPPLGSTSHDAHPRSTRARAIDELATDLPVPSTTCNPEGIVACLPAPGGPRSSSGDRSEGCHSAPQRSTRPAMLPRAFGTQGSPESVGFRIRSRSWTQATSTGIEARTSPR